MLVENAIFLAEMADKIAAVGAMAHDVIALCDDCVFNHTGDRAAATSE